MIDKITKVGLSYHDVKFGDVEMPKLFAKQGENTRAFQFTISDLRGVVPDLENLEMAMNIEIRQYRDIVKATPLLLEDDTGVFLIEFPNIALNGTGKYNLVLSQNLDDEKAKNIYTKNGDIVIERNSIFDNEDGGNTLFDLEEFKESLAKQKEYLKQMQLHEKNTNEYKELADKYADASKESADLSLKIQGEMQTVFNSENERKENENIRIAQELERVNEEIKRVNKENERIEVESKRVSDELERINSEDIRKENETKRIAAEDIREGNEKSRVSNHTAMQESIRRWSLMMQDWIQAEEERVLSEKTRKELFNQMKKEFDEMMVLLGDNPVGNLTQELQALKNVTDKHFKSVVIEGDDLVLIRENMTELVVPLELNKYATVKALEELEALLTSTKTQLEMKIGKKTDKTYVDSELEKKANAADVNSKLESKADITYVDSELKNYAKISQLNELKAELLLAIEQGSAEAIKVYADIFSLGNSDANDIILNTGKIGLVFKNLTQSELSIWEELDTMEDVINSEEAFNTIINSTTAMNAVANSTTAMNAVINSTTAWNTVMNSTTAWNTVINSTTAMNAVANSTTALKAIADSDKAMMTLINHSKTQTHTGENVKSINGIVLSTNLERVEIFSFADGTQTSTDVLPYKLSNGDYNVLKSYPKRAVSVAGYVAPAKVYYYPLA